MLPKIKLGATAPTGKMPIRPGAPRSTKPLSIPGAGVLAPTPFTAAGSAPKQAPAGLRPQDFGLTHFTPFTPPPGGGNLPASPPATAARQARPPITVPPGMRATKFIPPTQASVFEAAAKAAPTGAAAARTPLPMTHVDPFSGMEFAVKKGALISKGMRFLKEIVDPRALPPDLDKYEHAIQNTLDKNISRRLNTALRVGTKIPRGASRAIQEVIDSASSIVDASGHQQTPGMRPIFKRRYTPGQLTAMGGSLADDAVTWAARNPAVAVLKASPYIGSSVVPVYLEKVLDRVSANPRLIRPSAGMNTTALGKDFRVLKSLKDHIQRHG